MQSQSISAGSTGVDLSNSAIESIFFEQVRRFSFVPAVPRVPVVVPAVCRHCNKAL